MKYYELMKNLASKFSYRLEMVIYARHHGVSEAARVFKTTRKTLRKWIRRFDEGGMDGLRDQKRTPKRIPHRMSAECQARVIAARKRLPTWGARPLKDRFDIPYSHTAIHRVIRQSGLFKPKKRRYKKRRDLSELKKKLKLFEESQIDTKDLSDILPYWTLMNRLGLPRYEYTFRERSTGGLFFAYANENNSLYASYFARYVFEHLKSYGVALEETKTQTDNGSEYIGSAYKKINRPSAFERVLLHNRIKHGRIPPRCSWLQGDVENVHGRIEEEFYEVESYRNPMDFLGKAYAYQLYFNYLRKNRNRDNLSPVGIMRRRFAGIDEGVLNLPPIRLERLGKLNLERVGQGGYHVPWPLQSYLENS